jgi:transcriptional regulator with GAF, ATPase, and Fis domain
LLAEKTDGNPFFVIQFLKALEAQGVLSFQRAAHAWSLDLARAEAAASTENVLELLRRKLRHLAGPTREALTTASCLGNRFSLATLARLREQRPAQTAAALWEAILEGYLAPLAADYEIAITGEPLDAAAIEYRFSHDRVQQAAYDLIPPQDRPAVHLRLARLLAPDALFETVAHYNLATTIIVDDNERHRVAELNLAAGRKARASGAFQGALDLFLKGHQAIAGRPAESQRLGWALAVETAECELQCGEAERATARLEDVITRAPHPDLQAEAFRIRIVHAENSGRYADAVAIGLSALPRFGITIPASDRALALETELRTITHLLEARGPGGSAETIERLIQLPTLAAGEAKLAAVLIAATWPSAFLTNQPGLPALLSAHLVRLSIAHGNTEESAIGYITHALTVNARSRDYRAGHAFGQLGLAVNERFDDIHLRAKAQHLFGSFLAFWGEPIAQGGRHARQAHRAALDSGDFTYAARAAFMGTWYTFFAGPSLLEFEAQASEAISFLQRLHHDAIALAQRIPLQWSRALRGLTNGPVLSDGDFDQEACAATFAQVPIFTGFLAIAQASVAYTFGDPQSALAHARRAAEAAYGSPENLWHPFLDFIHGLAAAAAFAGAPADAQAQLLTRIDELCETTRIRAEACPVNFAYQHLLLMAERARIRNCPTAEVNERFARAITAADQAGAPHARALARELAGRHALASGNEAAAQQELEAAVALYAAWGATAKARQLQRNHAGLLDAPGLQPLESAGFDAASALKAAQAIAGELEIARLLPRLLDIVIENAGAERGVLIEDGEDGDALTVVADRRLGENAAGPRTMPLAASTELPIALVKAVHAAGRPVLLREARQDDTWARDPYVARAAVRSILCVPLLRHTLAKGVLYLENRLTADVFTEARAETVAVLASQAAISLENARLYAAMKSEVARRTQAEEDLKRALLALEVSAKRLEAENVYLQEEIRTQHNFEEIIGNSAALLDALLKLERVAATDSSVLILGETGTGKELFARAIHSRSKRRDRPLVKVNCAAIASGLVESELFGHVKGAFTGALQRRVGRFELADGGTLFLDEVGELPPDTQAKLLRVLQEQEFEPVGSSRTQRVDVRVIAATNRDLEEAVRAGRFRADLLYRLNVFPIAVPPLRRRRDDIPLLVGFFLTAFARKLGKRLDGFARADMERLSSWAWPGNVRELQNVVERAAILAEGPLARLDAIPLGPTSEEAPASAEAPPSAATIVEVERAHITAVLERAAWVVEGKAGAASILGLHPNTLRSRMKKLGIARGGRA